MTAQEDWRVNSYSGTAVVTRESPMWLQIEQVSKLVVDLPFSPEVSKLLTLSLPRVINFNFLFQSPTRHVSYSMENLAIDSLLRWKLIE